MGRQSAGNTFGGWGLKICTEDIAKFGQLYLQKGRWNGQTARAGIVGGSSHTKQVSNGSDPSRDWDQGYGFQFWRCRHAGVSRRWGEWTVRIVLPEQDAVIAITADTRDMQAELNVSGTKLLPAFQSAPLPVNPAGEAKLKEILSRLEVRPMPQKKAADAAPSAPAK